MRPQRRQVEEPPLLVLLHKATEKTPGLVAVIQMCLVPQIICAVVATFCQAAVKRGRQETGSLGIHGCRQQLHRLFSSVFTAAVLDSACVAVSV
jgi:hypothetical protein